MKRRVFAKAAAVLAASPSLLAAACEAEKSPLPKQKIIVVGAGLAGLRCAQKLIEKGHEVILLEAADRWGGRIRATKKGELADFAIELGAEEVHGQKSAWKKIVGARAQFVGDETTDFLDIDGQVKSEDSLANDADFQAVLAFRDDLDTYSGAEKTVEKLAAEKGIAPRFLPFLNARAGNEFGASDAQLSALGVARESDVWTAGDDDFLVADKSYEQIIEAEFSAVLPKIQLKKAVKSIDWASEKVKIECSDGSFFEADRVVLTVSLGILQAEKIAFLPALSTSKKAAISAIGWGSGLKTVLVFSERFWPADLGSLYPNSAAPEIWATNLGRSTQPVLTAFAMAEQADFLRANGTEATLLAKLDSLFSSQASKFFLRSKIQDWAAEPFVLGSYSFPKTGATLDLRRELSKNEGQKLFFAGEATHFAGHSATMHGAYETGERAADEILSL